ncbi:hypothetical protein [Micromonospora sp. NPDC050200]|uniref:hypothetical protein n=1 Tax=Micromonospora sp. NPDC050200 TaxID=3155664 RepID=UPI0033DDA29E
MATWWELAIPAVAGLAAGLGGAAIAGRSSYRTATEVSRQEAEERRQRQFVEQRRAAYVGFLAALKEWQPLRDRDWSLRAAADEPTLTAEQRETAMSRWERSRELTEPYFRRLVEAEQEIQLLAPRPIRDITTLLFVESGRRGATGRLMEEFMQAARLDLGTDPDPVAAGSPLLENPDVWRPGIPSVAQREA